MQQLFSTLELPLVRGNGQGWEHLLPVLSAYTLEFTPVDKRVASGEVGGWILTTAQTAKLQVSKGWMQEVDETVIPIPG